MKNALNPKLNNSFFSFFLFFKKFKKQNENIIMLRKLSPVFTFKNITVINPNQEYIFDFESLDKKTPKFLPFEIVKIFNFSKSDILVKIPPTEEEILPSGNEILKTNVRYLIVKNISNSSIPEESIYVNAQGYRK